MLNYEVIKNALHEEIMLEYENPREIRERTKVLVSGSSTVTGSRFSGLRTTWSRVAVGR